MGTSSKGIHITLFSRHLCYHPLRTTCYFSFESVSVKHAGSTFAHTLSTLINNYVRQKSPEVCLKTNLKLRLNCANFISGNCLSWRYLNAYFIVCIPKQIIWRFFFIIARTRKFPELHALIDYSLKDSGFFMHLCTSFVDFSLWQHTQWCRQ